MSHQYDYKLNISVIAQPACKTMWDVDLAAVLLLSSSL